MESGEARRDGAEVGGEGDFYRSVFDHANDTIVSFDDTGIMVHVSPSSSALFGYRPDQLVGRNITEYLHPDDVERAFYVTANIREQPNGLSSGSFRIRHSDGSWVPIDATGEHAEHEGRVLTVVHLRYAPRADIERAVLLGLVEDRDLALMFAPVLDSISWSYYGSKISIAWLDGLRWRHVHTDVPAALSGAIDEEPWTTVRSSGVPAIRTDLDGLSDADRRCAEDLGLGGYWIESIATDDPMTVALITVWTSRGRAEPLMHEYGVATAKYFVDVILQFTRQRRQLAHAASHDPLTDLSNRKALVEALHRSEHSGSILYCDLDGFKQVNDRYGHAIGDDLLACVADRLVGCVRSDDVVARIGGDEFVIMCPGMDTGQTEQLAARLVEELAQPFHIGSMLLQVGASIGLFHTERLGEGGIAKADKAMYEAKQAGRGTFRWHE